MKLVVITENGYWLIRRGVGGLPVQLSRPDQAVEQLRQAAEKRAMERARKGEAVRMEGSLPGIDWVWLPRGSYAVERAGNPFFAGGPPFIVLKGSRVGAAEGAMRSARNEIALVEAEKEAKDPP